MTRLDIGLGVDARLVTEFGSALVLTPDGRTLAFAAPPRGGTRSQLYVRHMDHLQATALPGTEGAYGPFFSPDGAWIGFATASSLKKIPAGGGVAQVIVNEARVNAADWGRDDMIYYTPREGAGGVVALARVSASGGQPETVATVDTTAHENEAWLPEILPDGKTVLISMFAHYGYDKLKDMDPKRVALVDLNSDQLIRKTVPNGKRMLSREIPLVLEQADVIINLPVMKTHFAALASLSVKNLQGAIPPLEKYMSHFFGLWQNLVNTHYLRKPKLSIVDGLTGQEGLGPVTGTSKPMNLLIGGTNPVAVDAITMRIMGLDPVLSPPVMVAYMQGLGPIEPEKIQVVGASVGHQRSEEQWFDPRGLPLLTTS